MIDGSDNRLPEPGEMSIQNKLSNYRKDPPSPRVTGFKECKCHRGQTDHRNSYRKVQVRIPCFIASGHLRDKNPNRRAANSRARYNQCAPFIRSPL